jgi:hypothetical protein
MLAVFGCKRHRCYRALPTCPEMHNAALAEYARWSALSIALGTEIPSQV